MDMITIPKDVYETERKMRFFGGSVSEVYKKKWNIFIGISISNKKISLEIAMKYLRWAVRNTKKEVAVVIADELNIVNYRIFDGYSPGKAEKRAKTVGDRFEKYFYDAKEKLNATNVNIFRWKDIKNPQYNAVHALLSREYKRDSEFKAAVLYFVRKYMRKKGKMIDDQQQVDVLATYILGELPTLLEGIVVNKVHFGLCMYPTFFASGMSQFVMDIHEGELAISSKVKSALKRKAVLVESWLD